MSKLIKILLALTISSVSLSANADYTFTDLGTPSGSLSVAESINNLGQIVGEASSSNSIPWHAMLWNNGAAIQLDTGESYAWGINNSGQVVGRGSNSHATLWDNGAVTDLGTLAGNGSVALGINDSGKVVGGSNLNGVLWNNGVASALVPLDPTTNPGGQAGGQAYSINSSGQIVGMSLFMGNWHATLWDNGVPSDLGTLGNGNTSQANSINNSGQVVGWSTSEGVGMIHATLWSNGVATNLGELGNDVGNYSHAHSINNSGQVVGITYFSGGGGAATLWSNGNIVDLNTLLSASDVAAGWRLMSANSINDNGSIVGQAQNNLLGIHAGAFLLSVAAVPEVDTSAMLLIGLGLFGFITRRKAI